MAAPSVAFSEERLALVIGNSRYEYASPLRNPENDIKLVSESLIQTGFKVTLLDNVRRVGMDAALKQFIEQAKKLDHPTIVIYYAGHGTQIDGDNYLLPIDAKVDTSKSLSESSISLGRIADDLSTVSANLQLLVIDACRDDPFRAKGRGISRGLARVGETKGRLIAFSTSPGSLAQDGSSGTSPYASALAETILVPGLSLEDTFKRTRQLVQERTHGQQEPWENGSLYGTFYFSPASGPSEVPTAEQDFWDLTSMIDTEEAYKKYLNRFHGGRFAKLANQKIAALNKDFSFRRQNETFPILIANASATKVMFSCKNNEGKLSEKFNLRDFGALDSQIIYIDISVSVDDYLCGDKIQISRLNGENVSSAEICKYKDIYKVGESGASFGSINVSSEDKCMSSLVSRLGFNSAEFRSFDNIFIADDLSDHFYAPIMDKPYFLGAGGAPEGNVDETSYRFVGLVRVHANGEEEDMRVWLEPVDPSELGMSAKFSNTQEAVRSKTFVKAMDLALQAEAKNSQLFQASEPARNDVAVAKQITGISSYWLHNGSIVGLKRDGNRRSLIYIRPRDGLDTIGIRAGTVLFDGGTSDGSLYQGQSQTFLKRCGSAKFPISGLVSSDNKAITLTGLAPKFDIKCRQVGFGQATLNFSFVGTSAAVDIANLIGEHFPSSNDTPVNANPQQAAQSSGGEGD